MCASCPACVCSVCIANNLCFGISKSASCLSMKDIHSIFVSQTIPQRCAVSFSAALDSHSNQVCRVTEQIIQMKKKEKNETVCKGLEGKWKNDILFYPEQILTQLRMKLLITPDHRCMIGYILKTVLFFILMYVLLYLTMIRFCNQTNHLVWNVIFYPNSFLMTFTVMCLIKLLHVSQLFTSTFKHILWICHLFRDSIDMLNRG